MDLSALIFVALAVAWAVYLIPKALKHHDDVVRGRSVDRFSHTMRVLARREPVNRRNARLVVTPGRPASTSVVVSKASSAAEPVAAPELPAAPVAPAASAGERRAAAVAAARRRLRVVLTILALNVLVVALAASSVVPWVVVAIPVVLLVAWLVACRLMVKKERAVRPVASRPRVAEPAPIAEGPVTEEIAAVAPDEAPVEAPLPRDPALWDPVPVTLPTYVGKPAAARRTVRTIDLDDTGVWTSGRSESDSQLARGAEAAERAARSRGDGDASRAVGS